MRKSQRSLIMTNQPEQKETTLPAAFTEQQEQRIREIFREELFEATKDDREAREAWFKV
jgi:hypothetical protein